MVRNTKNFFVFLMSFLLVLLLSMGFLSLLSPVQVVNAAEGTQFNVGMLVDETFMHVNSEYGSPGNHSKISGWEVYTTGGTFDYQPWHWFKIIDNSTNDNVTFKKRFTRQTSGETTFFYRFSMPVKMDGMSWQLNDGDIVGIKIFTSGGNLCYEASNGNAVTLQSYDANIDYGVKVVADISAKTADIYVNGMCRATGVAFRNNVSLNYVVIKTGDSQTGNVYLSPVRVYKGYYIYENFEASMDSVPGDWTVSGNGGTITANQWKTQGYPDIYSLKLNDTSTSDYKTIARSFNNKNVKSVFEYNFIIPSKIDGMTAEIKNGSTVVVRMVTNNGNICYENSSGTPVSIWDNYKANVWYKIKVVADPSTSTADIYVNGKLKATGVSFRNVASSFNSIVFSTPVSAAGTIWIDDIMFYPYQDYPADYVPQPEPVASTDYYMGVQSFPGNKNGYHLGWEFPYAWPEHDLYMGTFDEDKPEAEDWQIKFLVEHGVDFFMDCWYGNSWSSGNDPNWETTPLKYPGLGHNIHDAYFNAKYSNMVKFAIADYNCYYTSSYFRNVIVPFWVENYFKDPRYLTIDNKVVISIANHYDGDLFVGRPIADIRADLDYLRQECINAGFSGAILLTRYQSNVKAEMDNLYSMGFDYAYPYSYGTSNITVMEQKMNDAKNTGSNLGYLPCVSVGWSSEAWDDVYTGRTSVTDYQTLCNWVKDNYMPSLPSTSLGKKFILADNWNEYGEGHWINPGSLCGFGYLDAMRNTFAGGGSHTDNKPNLSQKMRLNSNFPKGWHGHSWNFDSFYIDTEGWHVSLQITNFNVSNGYLSGTITGNDPSFISRDNQGIDLSVNRYVKIRYKNSSSGTAAKVYFTTTTDTAWNEAKGKVFSINANDIGYTEYVIDMSTVLGWTGTLKQLRIDPVESGASSGSFSIDYIIVTDDNARTWEFTPDVENWYVGIDISGFGWQSGGYAGGTVTNIDPSIFSSDNLCVDITDNKIVKIKMKNNTASTTGQIYFITDADTIWDEAKHKDFTINANDANYTEYVIDMSSIPGWTGTLKRLRIDPEQGASTGSFSIDYLRIPLENAKAWEYTSNVESWTAVDISGFGWQTGGYAEGVVTNIDPHIVSNDNLCIDISNKKTIKVKMKNNTASTTGQVYFITDADTAWSEAKHKDFTINANDANYTEYVIDMSSIPGWGGTLKRLRLDPEQGASTGSFSIDYLRINR